MGGDGKKKSRSRPDVHRTHELTLGSCIFFSLYGLPLHRSSMHYRYYSSSPRTNPKTEKMKQRTGLFPHQRRRPEWYTLRMKGSVSACRGDDTSRIGISISGQLSPSSHRIEDGQLGKNSVLYIASPLSLGHLSSGRCEVL